MTRMLLLAGTAILALTGSAHAANPCGGSWLSTKQFTSLSAEERVAELQRLADGLSQGCSEAMNGLGYLTATVPDDYPAALRWFSILIKVSETQARQIGVQSSLVDQFLEKIKTLTIAVEAAGKRARLAEDDAAALQGRLNTLTDERDRLNGMITVNDEAVRKAKLEVAALTDERNFMAKQIEDARQSALEAAEKFQKLSNDYMHLDEVLKTKMAELDSARLARDQAAESAAECEKRKVEIEAQLKEREAQITDLEAENARFRELVSSQALEIADLRKQLEKTRAELAGLTAEKQTLERSLSDSLNREKKILDQLGTVNNDLKFSESALKETKSKLNESERNLSTALYDKKNISNLLDAKIIEFDNQTRDLARVQEELGAATSRLKDATNEIVALKGNIASLEKDLASKVSENSKISGELETMRKALAGTEMELAAANARIDELKAVRSEFYARLIAVMGGREDIRIVGDRFVFQSEVLFDSGSADLSVEGRAQIEKVAAVLREIEPNIPANTRWVLQVNGHTDDRRIRAGSRYADNWELSTERALSVVRLLGGEGVTPQHLSAAGYGEFQPVVDGDTASALAPNRRIELKLTD